MKPSLAIRVCVACALTITGGLASPAVLTQAHSGAEVTTDVQTNELTTVRVKFTPGMMELRDGALRLSAAFTDQFPATGREDLAEFLDDLITGAVPVFRQPPEVLKAWQTGVNRSGFPDHADLPDLTQYFEVTPKPGLSPTDLVRRLGSRPEVMTAYVTPKVLVPTSPTGIPAPNAAEHVRADTPDFTAKQGYRRAGSGVDADFANTMAGGAGQGVRIHDIEIGWDRAHEDLETLARPEAFVPQTDKPAFGHEQHGTAAMGMVVGTKNGRGITGVAHAAEGQMTNVNYNRFYTNIGGAITSALTALRPGDVIFVVVGISGCDTSDPRLIDTFAEFEPATYDAIKTAVARGVHVIQSAGNGAQNFDHQCYAKYMPPMKAHSGSIVVGAGGAGVEQGAACNPARSAMFFSNYGTRVDVQGWGECVTTAGYGDLHNGGPHADYTAGWGGTSSAAPLLAGVVGALSGVAKAHGKTLTPAQMRELLVSTGTPQPEGSNRRIGPLPNLKKAIAVLTGEG